MTSVIDGKRFLAHSIVGVQFGDVVVPAGLGVCVGSFPLHRHEGSAPDVILSVCMFVACI